MDWYLMVWQKYAQFTGRSRRKEYWMFTLFNMIAYMVLAAAVVAALVVDQKTLGTFLLIFCGVYALAGLVPGLAVGVRRLHDINKSGWWMLLCFVPFGGLVLLILACIEGDPGNNQFGPNPRLFAQPAMS